MIRVADFWFGDHLSISVVKHSINPDLTQDVDFQVRLDKGGSTMVYAHVASNYFTIKGPNFCGRSASHVIFDKVVRPLLEKTGREDVETERSSIKEEEPSGIIDLTGIDDIDDMDEAEVEEFLDNMSRKRGQPLKRPRQGLKDGEMGGEEREEEEDEQGAKRQHTKPVLSGLTARLQEIFPQVPFKDVQQRCHALLKGRDDFASVEHVFEKLTEEFLQDSRGSGLATRSTLPAMPNVVDHLVQRDTGMAVKVESESGVDNVEPDVSNDHLGIGSVKTDVKEEYGFEGIFDTASGNLGRQVKEELLATELKKDNKPSAITQGTPIRGGKWKTSKQLAKLLDIGADVRVSKASVLRRLWMRLENLELLDPVDQRYFTPDEAMKDIFGPVRIRATHMEKVIKDHLVKDGE